MNIQEYISSGIIENYVLGLTTAQESSDVLSMAAKYPEVKAEIDAVENTLQTFLQKQAVTPPAYLKEKIITAIDKKVDGKIIKMQSVEPQKNILQWLAVAASILLIISASVNIYFYSDLNKTQLAITELSNKNSILADNLAAINTNYNQSKEQLAFIKDPMNKMVRLAGTPKSPNALVHIFWNTKTKQVYAEINTLPQAPDSMQYQLWAIADGKPVDAGMITLVTDSVLFKMKDIPNAQAFAITLEKKGGSQTPQGDMYVLGKVEENI